MGADIVEGASTLDKAAPRGAVRALPAAGNAETIRLLDRGAGPSCEDLVTSNLSVVSRLAREYRNMGLPVEDLVSEGNIGLMEAVRHFDRGRGTKFSHYAVWWIRKSMLNALTQGSAAVRVPRSQLNKLSAIRKTETLLSHQLGRKAGREEISRELRLTASKMDRILLTKMQQMSLDDKVGREKDTPLSEHLANDRSVNPEDELIRREDQHRVREVLRGLGDIEQTVIINRFGVGGGPRFNLSEIGEKVGLTRERVRQIHAQALRRLRGLIARQTWIATRKTRARSAYFPIDRKDSLDKRRIWSIKWAP